MSGNENTNSGSGDAPKHDFNAIRAHSVPTPVHRDIVSDHYARDPKFVKEPNQSSNPFVMLVTGFFRWIFDSVQVIVIALAIFIVFYLFIVSPHTIDGVSMQPNFCNGDLILADKLSPRFKGYNYGDVIVFKHDEANDYIKRIIGKTGDRIKVEDSKVYRNGQVLNETYLPQGRVTLIQPGDGMVEGEEYLVPEGKFLVFGDNRPNSTDSRRFLAIDPAVNTIKGRVVVVMWPLERARLFKDAAVYPANECSK
jgi:signal peptidase I